MSRLSSLTAAPRRMAPAPSRAPALRTPALRVLAPAPSRAALSKAPAAATLTQKTAMATEPPGSPKMDYPLKVSAFGGFSFEGEDFSFLLPPSSFLEKSFLLPRKILPPSSKNPSCAGQQKRAHISEPLLILLSKKNLKRAHHHDGQT